METIQAKKADKKSKKDKDESAIVDPLSAKEEIIDPLSQASFDPLSQTISDPLSQAVSDPLSAVLTENVKISSTFGAPVSKVCYKLFCLDLTSMYMYMYMYFGRRRIGI